MRFLLLALFMAVHISLYSQTWNGSAYGEALCGAMCTQTGAWSLGCNPAGMACAGWSAGVDYNSRFGVKQLSQKSARISAPLGRGTASSVVNYYGFRLYNTTRAMLGYALPLGKVFSAGISLNYHNIHIQDSPHRSMAFSGDLGLVCRISDGWLFSSCVTNVGNSQYSDSDTIIPVTIQAGICHTFYGGHSLRVEVDKSSLADPIAVRVGAVARLCQYVNVMAGYSLAPGTLGAGFEFVFRDLSFMFSVRRYHYLGMYPSASVAWSMANCTLETRKSKKSGD